MFENPVNLRDRPELWASIASPGKRSPQQGRSHRRRGDHRRPGRGITSPPPGHSVPPQKRPLPPAPRHCRNRGIGHALTGARQTRVFKGVTGQRRADHLQRRLAQAAFSAARPALASRRTAAGVTPISFLKTRLNADSDAYPETSAASATDNPRSANASRAICIRHAVT